MNNIVKMQKVILFHLQNIKKVWGFSLNMNDFSWSVSLSFDQGYLDYMY